MVIALHVAVFPPTRLRQQVDKNVEREIVNHRMLNHPNIVGFREVRSRKQMREVQEDNGNHPWAPSE